MKINKKENGFALRDKDCLVGSPFLTNIVEKNFQLFYTYSEGRRPPQEKRGKR